AGRLQRLPRVGTSAAEFWRALWMYHGKPAAVAASLGLSLVAQVGMVLVFYFAAQTFYDPGQDGQVPSLGEHFLIVPIGLVVQALVPTPGGVGGGEFGFGKLYGLLGAGLEPVGVMASLVNRVISWVVGLLGFLVYLRMRPRLASAPPEPRS